MLIRACIIVDSPELGDRLERVLRQPDVLLTVAAGDDPASCLRRDDFDLVIASGALFSRPYGDSLKAMREAPSAPEVVVLSEDGDPEGRASLQAAGAFAVVDRDLPEPSLRRALNTLIRRRRETLLGRLRVEEGGARVPADLPSASQAMRQVLEVAERVTQSDSSLLILGETGVGKEWLAQRIHRRGPRAGGPFIAVNCAALPGELIESELFGHVEGAFTGARRAQRGQFELAHRGTLFLDEVAEMPVAAQAKLLRVLQERQVRRVGGERAIEVDVRVMAATNRDPQEAMARRELRTDLYYRLGVVTLTLPPLRARAEDIPGLVEDHFQRLRRELRRMEVRRVSRPVLQALKAYEWPGNVRELINVLERAVLLCRGSELTLEDLSELGIGASGALPGEPWGPLVEESMSLPFSDGRDRLVEAFEREYLTRLLGRHRGRIGEAAREAEVNERTLYNRMRHHGLDKAEFRSPPAGSIGRGTRSG